MLCRTFCRCPAEDDDVIQVCQACLPGQAGEDSIHEVGKDSWRIAEAEGEDVEFIELSPTRGESCLGLVEGMDRDLPVPRLEIEGENHLVPRRAYRESSMWDRGVAFLTVALLRRL